MLRRRPHLLIAAVVLALTLSLVQPRSLVQTPCIWASAHLQVHVSDTEAAANETELSALADELGHATSMRASLDGPTSSNGSTRATIHLSGPPERGSFRHVDRLNFFAAEGVATAQVDILVSIRGLPQDRVSGDGEATLRSTAGAEGASLSDALRGRFGAVTVDIRSTESGTEVCSSPW